MLRQTLTLLIKIFKDRRRLLKTVVGQRNLNCMKSSDNKARNKYQSSS